MGYIEENSEAFANGVDVEDDFQIFHMNNFETTEVINSDAYIKNWHKRDRVDVRRIIEV